MSLRPDHVEAASPRLWRGLFAGLATYFRRRPCPQASRLGFDAASGVMLERDSPAVEPAEGQMGNVGLYCFPDLPGPERVEAKWRAST